MIWLLLGILLILALGWFLTGFFMFRNTFHRSPPQWSEEENDDEKPFDMRRKGLQYCAEHFPEEVWLRKDELWMHAFWVDNHSDRTAVVIHGYRGHALDRCGSIPYYTERGFNVLLPDLRAHGSSEGHWIGFGVPDASDAAEWVRWLRQNASTPQRVLLDGVSMGASTVLTVSGTEDLPELKLVLADCAFTSAQEEQRHVAQKCPKLLFNLLFAAENRWNHILTGHDFRLSALEAVSRSHTPTLFVHGQKDELVPPSMSERLYAACNAPKQILRVADAGHTEAFAANPEAYLAALDEMIERYIPETKTEA